MGDYIGDYYREDTRSLDNGSHGGVSCCCFLWLVPACCSEVPYTVGSMVL